MDVSVIGAAAAVAAAVVGGAAAIAFSFIFALFVCIK